MIKLRDYQDRIAAEAVQKLQTLGIVYLSMEVRTGKTFTSLEAAHRYGATKVLLVTVKKAIKGIEGDVEAYGKLAVDVISMDSVHKVENPEEYDLIIADEAHQIGGRFPKPSKRAKELRRVAFDKPLILMSGTPSPESYSQLFHQFWVSKRSPFAQYKNFYEWARAGYVRVIQKMYGNRPSNDYSGAVKEKIQPILDAYFISFTQKQADFKCEVSEHIEYVQMQPSTMKMVADLKKDKVLYTPEGVVLADTPVKLLSKVHQICSGTVILEEEGSIPLDFSKVEYIQKHFGGLRTAIYYKYTQEYQMLKERLGDALTDDVEAFKRGDAQHIALQIRAGSMGINLSEADCQIFMNISWSSKDYIQAKARLQTQKRDKVDVYFLFAKGGVEEKIYRVLQKKRDFTSAYYKQYFGR